MIVGAAFCLLIRTAAVAGAAKPTVAGNSSPAKVTKKRARTLPELVNFALASGEKVQIPILGIQHLGFSGEKIDTLAISYERSETKDGYEHLMFVVYDPTIVPIVPQGLLWQKLLTEKIGKFERVEMHSYHSTLSGELLFAARSEGLERIQQISIPITAEVKKNFQRDVEFLLKKSLAMKLST